MGLYLDLIGIVEFLRLFSENIWKLDFFIIYYLKWWYNDEIFGNCRKLKLGLKRFRKLEIRDREKWDRLISCFEFF